MDWQALFVLGLAFAMLALLVSGRARVDAIGIGLMVAPVLAGILTYQEAVSGLGNKAILTIAGLYVVGEGLLRTGAVEAVAGPLLRAARGSERRLILTSCACAALVSSFLNDTAVVLVMMPVLLSLARTMGVPASRLLMPLAFSSLLGGMNTLIGTSTNVLVSSVAEQRGLPPIGMFELTPIAVVTCATGILYLALLAPRLLPARQSLASLASAASTREYMTEIAVGPASPLVGRRYADVLAELRVELLFFVRNEEMVRPPHASYSVAAGDVLMLGGGVDAIADLEARLSLRTVGGVRGREAAFLEIAVAPHSPLVGRKLEDLELWRDFGAVAIAVLRAGQHVRSRIAQLHLRPGDLLLVAADEGAEARLRASSDFYVVTGAQQEVRLRQKSAHALAIAAAVVALFTLTSVLDLPNLPQPFVALGGGLAMIATGCVTPRRVYRTIDWPILIFIAGTLALGTAMERTGILRAIAESGIALLAPWGAPAILGGIVLACLLLNGLIAHSAVAVLMTPIAIESARAFCAARGLALDDPHAAAFLRSAVLAVAYGGSLCFATPVGHQVNLMVMGAGSYRYGDFVRLGLPLSVLLWLVLSAALALSTGSL